MIPARELKGLRPSDAVERRRPGSRYENITLGPYEVDIGTIPRCDNGGACVGSVCALVRLPFPFRFDVIILRPSMIVPAAPACLLKYYMHDAPLGKARGCTATKRAVVHLLCCAAKIGCKHLPLALFLIMERCLRGRKGPTRNRLCG